MTIEFKDHDEFLKEQIVNSDILQAIESLDLANYPESQKHLADFLKSVGLSPKGIISNYKSQEEINEMKKGIEGTFEAVKTTVAA